MRMNRNQREDEVKQDLNIRPELEHFGLQHRNLQPVRSFETVPLANVLCRVKIGFRERNCQSRKLLYFVHTFSISNKVYFKPVSCWVNNLILGRATGILLSLSNNFKRFIWHQQIIFINLNINIHSVKLILMTI